MYTIHKAVSACMWVSISLTVRFVELTPQSVFPVAMFAKVWLWFSANRNSMYFVRRFSIIPWTEAIKNIEGSMVTPWGFIPNSIFVFQLLKLRKNSNFSCCRWNGDFENDNDNTTFIYSLKNLLNMPVKMLPNYWLQVARPWYH